MDDLKFTSAEDNILITLIKKNKALYDPACEVYKDSAVRDNIWGSISTYLNKTDEECRRRWKHIRDSYNRHKRNRKVRSKTRKSKWDFFQKLSFLEKIQSDENIEGNTHDNSDSDPVRFSYLPRPQPTVVLNKNNNDKDVDDTKPLQSLLTPTAPEQAPPARKKRKFDELLDFMKQKEENRQNNIEEMKKSKMEEKDDDYTFGNHVKSVIKKLTPRLKVLAKKEIFDSLLKYETLNLDVTEQWT